MHSVNFFLSIHNEDKDQNAHHLFISISAWLMLMSRYLSAIKNLITNFFKPYPRFGHDTRASINNSTLFSEKYIMHGLILCEVKWREKLKVRGFVRWGRSVKIVVGNHNDENPQATGHSWAKKGLYKAKERFCCIKCDIDVKCMHNETI
jgi:hypothetical protein